MVISDVRTLDEFYRTLIDSKVEDKNATNWRARNQEKYYFCSLKLN